MTTLDDWIEAEVEVVRTYRHDLTKSAEAIVFKAELPCSFTADQLNVSVESRRLMVNGGRELDVICGGDTPAHTEKRAQRIFGVEELPVDVDPSRSTAKLKGDTLEIVMRRVAVDNKSSGKSKASVPGTIASAAQARPDSLTALLRSEEERCAITERGHALRPGTTPGNYAWELKEGEECSAIQSRWGESSVSLSTSTIPGSWCLAWSRGCWLSATSQVSSRTGTPLSIGSWVHSPRSCSL